MSYKIDIYSDGIVKNSQAVKAGTFDKAFNESLIHQVVVAYQARGRSGTKAQKSRAEVSGGGAKPWKQKGGGRARAGSIRSPLWRTGGVTFAATNRKYEQKINRKMYKGALASVISELIRQGRLLVSDDVYIEGHKTKQLIQKLSALTDLKNRTLIVVPGYDTNLWLASRNLATVEVCTVQSLSPVSLVSSHRVIVSGSAY